MADKDDFEYYFEHLSSDDRHPLQSLRQSRQKQIQQYDRQHIEQEQLEQQRLDQNLKQKHLEQQRLELQLEQQKFNLQLGVLRIEQQRIEQQQIKQPLPQQLQQKPFHIVLIDIKAAAQEHVIRCVEKPLAGDEDLKYVALSYRWGELNEVAIDTQLGYLATITSFALKDFYHLCKAITLEMDLRSMKYVWVDAICVDQHNYERRKATIHQMSNIYARANYILAVPDLHREHLRHNTPLKIWNVYSSRRIGEYIFHLLHGNRNKLDQLMHDWFDGAMAEHGLEKLVSKRSNDIQDVMYFIISIFDDWSNRVWVISECGIAKKKGKMKYFFVEFCYQHCHKETNPFGEDSFFEFQFDVDTSSNIGADDQNIFALDSTSPLVAFIRTTNFCYRQFHKMNFQLQQNFLPMILQSKASRNEDRFHAILPNSSKYKHVIENKDVVDSWKITHLISVKLKLFEIMDASDKLRLLFLSGRDLSLTDEDAFPTFASSNINWYNTDSFLKFDLFREKVNFDLTSKSVITLNRIDNHDHDDNNYDGYKLNIKPRYFYLWRHQKHCNDYLLEFWKKRQTLCKRLELDHANSEPFDVLCITRNEWCVKEYFATADYSNLRTIFLVGSVHKNKWILSKHKGLPLMQYWNEFDVYDGDNIGFDIY